MYEDRCCQRRVLYVLAAYFMVDASRTRWVRIGLAETIEHFCMYAYAIQLNLRHMYCWFLYIVMRNLYLLLHACISCSHTTFSLKFNGMGAQQLSCLSWWSKHLHVHVS